MAPFNLANVVRFDEVKAIVFIGGEIAVQPWLQPVLKMVEKRFYLKLLTVLHFSGVVFTNFFVTYKWAH